MSNGDFREKCFPIQQLYSCQNGEKEYRKNERRRQKIEMQLGFERKTG